METLNQDFEIEYSRLDFSYKSVLNTDAFKNELLTEFEGLTPKIDVMLYVADKMDLNLLDAELADARLTQSTANTNVTIDNGVPIDKHKYENEYYRLSNEFYKLDSKTIDKKYFRKFLKDAPTINLLNGIYTTFNNFENFVLENTNDNYQAYATMVANEVIRSLNGKSYKNILLNWFLMQQETPFMLLYLNEGKESHLQKLYSKLKGYFNEVVSFELSKITAQKDSGIERFTLDKKQAIDIYELCIKYEVFSEPPISEIDFLKCFDAINEISIYPKFTLGKKQYFYYILAIAAIKDNQVLKQFGIKDFTRSKKGSALKAKRVDVYFKKSADHILTQTKVM